MIIQTEHFVPFLQSVTDEVTRFERDGYVLVVECSLRNCVGEYRCLVCLLALISVEREPCVLGK